MTLAHLHLVTNHFPIVGIIIAALLFLFGLAKSNDSFKRAALYVAMGAAVFALPAYFTGEDAEGAAMKILGTSKHMIHEHEEAGELGLILILITGVLAAVQVFFAKKIAGKEKIFTLLTAVMLLVCSGSMAYVGSLGGKVRRPELRGEVPAKLLATEADLAQTEVECTHDKKDGEAHEAGGTHEAGEAHEHDEAHEHTDAK